VSQINLDRTAIVRADNSHTDNHLENT